MDATEEALDFMQSQIEMDRYLENMDRLAEMELEVEADDGC